MFAKMSGYPEPGLHLPTVRFGGVCHLLAAGGRHERPPEDRLHPTDHRGPKMRNSNVYSMIGRRIRPFRVGASSILMSRPCSTP